MYINANSDRFSGMTLNLVQEGGIGNFLVNSLGNSFSSIWAAITHLHWSRIAVKCKCYQEECMTNQLKYRRDP